MRIALTEDKSAARSSSLSCSIIAIMVGAIVHVHLPNGFDISKGGYEYNLAIIIMCACLVLGGPGPIAVDRWFKLRRRRE